MKTQAKLTAHVLDTLRGRPAAGVAWTLERHEGAAAWILLAEGATNADGRSDGPMIRGAALETGRYRLRFDIGDYFRACGAPLPDPPFFDWVAIEANLQAGERYHVPLLASPWSYTTYRGS